MPPRSVVPLPPHVRTPYEVFLNGVRQRAGTDFVVEGGALVFPLELKRDEVSGWRWFLGAWGVGTYRQDDSVDVRWVHEGRPMLAERLPIADATG